MNITERVFTTLHQVPNPKAITKRLALLRALRVTILKHEDEILDAIHLDTQKMPYEAYITELHPVYAELHHFIKNLKKWATPYEASFSLGNIGSSAEVRREPFGIVLVYAPWNYPFQLLLMPLIAAISGGNKVMLSASPSAPHTAQIVSDIIDEVFIDGEALLLPIDQAEPKTLLHLPFDYIFYTGNPTYGHIVAKEAAARGIPTTLELGGKSPCIVLSDANLRLAARRIAWAKLLNAGQTCIAPDYLLVDREIISPFIKYLKRALSEQLRLITNDPEETMLPLIRPAKAKEVQEWITEAGEVLYGGKVDVERGRMMPTIILSPDEDHAVMRHEIFAPLLPIIPIDSADEAIAYISGLPKPLALYTFGSESTFDYIIEKTESGSALLNDCMVQLTHHDLPFGGVGRSGYGRYHGKAGYETFTVQRSVMKASQWIDPPIRYHLGAPIETLRKGILKWGIWLLERF